MSVLSKIYTGSKDAAGPTLLELYKKQGSLIVSFLYFANCMKARLFEEQKIERQKTYKKALESADVLFADGIALQWFYRWSTLWRKKGITPENLNGTDFIPQFLDELVATKASVHWAMHTMYDPRIWKSKEQVHEAVAAIESRFWITMDYVQQNDYVKRMEEPFDSDAYMKTRAGKKDYFVLLLFTWTPAQEIWSYENTKFIEENNVLVINAGGTIDYISWFETRAPNWVVKARVLETPWRIMQNPKKNFHKFASMFGIVRIWWWLLLKK